MPIEFAEMKGVEIFRTGTWKGSKQVTITEDDLDAMVASFDALAPTAGLRPPLKLGHSDAQKFMRQGGSGAPALGWVDRIWRDGNRVLADFSSVPGTLLDMIKRRLYNSLSIELFQSYEFEGTVYRNVLAAVAILGAELPAVKGLKELSASLFDDTSTERIALTEHEGEPMPATYTQEQLDALVEAAVAKARAAFKAETDAAVVKLQADLTDLQAQVTEQKQRAERAEVALTTFREDAAKARVVGAVDALIKEGRLLPKEKDAVIAFAQSLDAKSKIKFGDKEQSPLDQYLDQLAARPKVVDFSERGAGKGEGERSSGARAEEELDAKAKAKVAASNGKVTYSEAVQNVLAEDEDLKRRYAAGL